MIITNDLEAEVIRTLINRAKLDYYNNPTSFSAFKDFEVRLAFLEYQLNKTTNISELKTVKIEAIVKNGEVQDINIQDLPFYLNVVKMVKDYDVEGTPEVFLNEDETGKHKAAIL